MDTIILLFFVSLIFLLNVNFFILFRKKKLNLILSGIIMLILSPVLGFISGSWMLHEYDWSGGGTGEGPAYGGAFIGVATVINGLFLLGTGILLWLVSLIRK